MCDSRSPATTTLKDRAPDGVDGGGAGAIGATTAIGGGAVVGGAAVSLGPVSLGAVSFETVGGAVSDS